MASVCSHGAEGAVRDRGSTAGICEQAGADEGREKPQLSLFKVSHIYCHDQKPNVPIHDRVTLQIEIKHGRSIEMAQCVETGQSEFIPQLSQVGWRYRLLQGLLCPPHRCVMHPHCVP